MPLFFKRLLIALIFDYLYDEFIWFLRKYSDPSENPIDDAVVNWLEDMREVFKGQLGQS